MGVAKIHMCQKIFIILSTFGITGTTQKVSVLSHDKQVVELNAEEEKCRIYMKNGSKELEGAFCNRTWDNVMCWPDTPAGETAFQPCPIYIHGFDQAEYATKDCLEDGTWFVNNSTGQPWTNFSACIHGTPLEPISKLIQEHMPRLKLMYTIGYSLSLTALTLAVAIMVYFKRLHCPRNMIHLNLFLAFLVRASMSLMRESLLVNDLGFPPDVIYDENGKPAFSVGPHWECRLFFTLYHYSIMTSLFWIFNEGLYLQLILSVAVFADKTKIRWFVLFGWGTPIIFVIPWALTRIYLDNTLCWNVRQNAYLFWIIQGPLTVSVIINFCFFVNIVRLLFTKLTASNCPETRKFRYRRLAKSTLILIPLFAVYYMGFIWLPPHMDDTGELLKMYIELVFNSFQGFFVTLLFCFLNTEVQTEIRKRWQRHIIRKTSSVRSVRSVGSFFHRNSTKHHDLSPRTMSRSFQEESDVDQKHGHPNGHLPPHIRGTSTFESYSQTVPPFTARL